MRVNPVFPIICVEHQYRWLECVRDPKRMKRTTLMTYLYHQPANFVYFDSRGYRWKLVAVDGRPKRNLLNRLLAHTVYNPVIAVENTWMEERTYALDELKVNILKCVRNEDLRLTRLTHEQSWIKKLEEASTFSRLCLLVETLGTEDYDKIIKK